MEHVVGVCRSVEIHNPYCRNVREDPWNSIDLENISGHPSTSISTDVLGSPPYKFDKEDF